MYQILISFAILLLGFPNHLPEAAILNLAWTLVVVFSQHSTRNALPKTQIKRHFKTAF